MLRTLSIIHWVKLLQPFSQLTRDQQGSAYNHSFITFIQIYGCKETPVGLLYAEKMAVVVLLNVLLIGFSASPLWILIFSRVHVTRTMQCNKFRFIKIFWLKGTLLRWPFQSEYCCRLHVKQYHCTKMLRYFWEDFQNLTTLLILQF